jgi:hypothetical protein
MACGNRLLTFSVLSAEISDAPYRISAGLRELDALLERVRMFP